MKPKKIRDLVKDSSQKEKLNLRGNFKKKLSPIQKIKPSLMKQDNPIHKVIDLKGQKEKHFNYFKAKKFNPPKSLGNLVKLGFFGLFILILINGLSVYSSSKRLEENIKSSALEGFSLLVDASENATKVQFDNAVDSFNNALDSFSDAEAKLWFISTDNSFYAKDANAAQAVNSLLEAGKQFSLSGGHFLEALEEFNKIPLYFATKNSDPDFEMPSITDTLKDGLEKTDLALAQVNLAWDLISEIDENTLPAEISGRVVFAKNQVEKVKDLLNSISSHFPAMLKLLGDRYPHRYLILLQNNYETRATGGFIGSYSIVDVNEGYIEKIDTQDVYQLDNYFGGYIEPPEELEPYTTNWRFRDSNYSPDFPISARKAMWFLEKEGGPSVDTVIAINQGLLKDMLEITGPVQVGDFGALTSENYDILISYIVESKVWGAEDPKHILKVFIPAFKEAILKEEGLSQVGFKLHRALGQKHVMFYSKDQEIQSLFESFNVAGQQHMPEEKEDYLSVINWSTGGTKSDQFIEENIEHHTEIDEHGNITDNLKITRTHMWEDSVYDRWKEILASYGFKDEMSGQLLDNLGKGLNRVTVRIYVPAGAILLESNGYDVETKYDSELKKTYFKTEVEVNAGETSDLEISYRLPFTLNFSEGADTYKVTIEKQPGSRGSILTKSIEADPELVSLSLYPKEVRTDHEGNFVYATNLVYDKYFASVWSK
jgi:hypothetical protein